jgi:hypothetical protein
MPFQLLDIANTFFISLQEGVPTSSSDVSTSRISIPNFLNILTMNVRKINKYTPYIQNAIIPVVQGTANYSLGTDFMEEISIRYRSYTLAKTNTTDDTFLVAAIADYPYQYSIWWPGTASSAFPVTGNPLLLVDPPPSETSPGGPPPQIPTFNDPYLMVTYKARIPTDFTTSNYTTYTFQLPEEWHPYLSDLCTAYVMSLEGKDKTFENTFKNIASEIQTVNSFVQSQAEGSPNIINPTWW